MTYLLNRERATKGSLSTTNVYDGVFIFGDVGPWEISSHARV
jgi:hypothetical protein